MAETKDGELAGALSLAGGSAGVEVGTRAIVERADSRDADILAMMLEDADSSAGTIVVSVEAMLEISEPNDDWIAERTLETAEVAPSVKVAGAIETGEGKLVAVTEAVETGKGKSVAVNDAVEIGKGMTTNEELEDVSTVVLLSAV